jgi:hypothetical protein
VTKMEDSLGLGIAGQFKRLAGKEVSRNRGGTMQGDTSEKILVKVCPRKRIVQPFLIEVYYV